MSACAFCLRHRAPWGECEHCGAVRLPASERTIKCIVAQLRRTHSNAAAAGENRIIHKLAADIIEELLERIKAMETQYKTEAAT